jgi:hypothetical protein
MKLVEIKGLFEMDMGAPVPLVISNDNELFLTFYRDKFSKREVPVERNTVYDEGVFVLNFKFYLSYRFGLPGNETIQGHPYYKLGLKPYSFFELKDSDFIGQLIKIERIHPYFNPEKWKVYKHYILTFHDNMFECIAEGFELEEKSISIYNQASLIVNELSMRMF